MRTPTLVLLVAGAVLAQDAAPKARVISKPGLPGVTPIKKAGTDPTQYNAFRAKYLGAFCPTASAEDKVKPPCKMHDITQKLKTATEAEKVHLAAERTKISDAAKNRTEEQKKAQSKVNMMLYKKMYAAYCTPDKKDTDAACTNALMKRIYGPSAGKAGEL